MPDLLTHLAVARAGGAWLRDRRVLALFVIGTFLPDLVAKGLGRLAAAHSDFAIPSHSAIGLIPLCYLAALFIEARIRRAAFGALYAGALVHVAVDLIKFNLGAGAGYPFAPLWAGGVELGWIAGENTLFLMPLNAAVLLAVWAAERRRAHVE